MVVAASTSDRQSHKGDSGGCYHVVKLVVARAFEFDFRYLRRENSSSQKTGRRQCHRIVRFQLVACQLPRKKLIEGHVNVERLNHEIAIVIGVRAIVVVFKATTFGKPSNIQPVTSPAFSEMLRLE